MRTTVRIDDDLYRRLKARAAQSGRTVGELVEDAVRESLRPRPSTAKGPIELPVFHGSGVVPGVDLSSNTAILHAMDDDVALDARR